MTPVLTNRADTTASQNGRQRLLTSFAHQDQLQEVDCNDEDVFKAVDTALKKYNNGSNSGNQFVLHRITEVINTGDRAIFYSVKYEIKEGDCPVQSGKTWQDCDYKEPEQAVSVMVRSLQFSQLRPNYSVSAGGDEYCGACL
ncbi:Kininogen-1 [Myotis brandtii]|uniref:Kininogen-1 n=1 Tax=Myotis brandtii TaxID=109478 RepID=S7MJX5_MYOBR|nr:Kininogen-1 [Myotis brandtii]